MDKTDRLLKSLRPRPQELTPIATEMFLPNHSGDHSAGTTGTPTSDLDIANKKYVDDSIAGITPGVTDHSLLTNLTYAAAGHNDFASGSHTHAGVYLPIADKAADSDLLDAHDQTYFAISGHNHTGTYLTAETDPSITSGSGIFSPSLATQTISGSTVDARYYKISGSSFIKKDYDPSTASEKIVFSADNLFNFKVGGSVGLEIAQGEGTVEISGIGDEGFGFYGVNSMTLSSDNYVYFMSPNIYFNNMEVGNYIFYSLPTSNPSVAGALYVSGGVVAISAG